MLPGLPSAICGLQNCSPLARWLWPEPGCASCPLVPPCPVEGPLTTNVTASAASSGVVSQGRTRMPASQADRKMIAPGLSCCVQLAPSICSPPPTRRDQLLGWLTTYYRCPPIPELVRWAEEILSWADEPTVTYLQAVAERGRVENGGRPVKIRWLEITASNLKQSGVRREEHTRDRTSPKPAVPGEYATAYATAASFADPAPADPAPLPTTLPAVPAPDRAAAEPLTLPADAGTDDPTPEPTQLPASPPTVPVPTAASYANPVLPAAPAPASDQHPRASPVPYPPVVPDQSLTPREEYRHDPASTQPRRPTPGKYAAAYATAASFAPSG